MSKIINAMKWRYAVQKFDQRKKLSDAQLAELLDIMTLSPSSFGLQPWKFIVVTNPEIRVQLRKAGYDQPKISEASHLIVFAVPKKIDDALIDTFIASVSRIQNVPLASLKGRGDMIKDGMARRTPAERVEWATQQVYIALGVLITSAAILGIDVGPMEGFEPEKFDEILGLDKLGLESKVLAAVGFRAADDARASDKKVRFSRNEVVIEVK